MHRSNKIIKDPVTKHRDCSMWISFIHPANFVVYCSKTSAPMFQESSKLRKFAHPQRCVSDFVFLILRDLSVCADNTSLFSTKVAPLQLSSTAAALLISVKEVKQWRQHFQSNVSEVMVCSSQRLLCSYIQLAVHWKKIWRHLLCY